MQVFLNNFWLLCKIYTATMCSLKVNICEQNRIGMSSQAYSCNYKKTFFIIYLDNEDGHIIHCGENVSPMVHQQLDFLLSLRSSLEQLTNVLKIVPYQILFS